MTFDDALNIVTQPTPAQEWLASLEIPEPEPVEECVDIISVQPIRSTTHLPGPPRRIPARLSFIAGDTEPPEICGTCGTPNCDEEEHDEELRQRILEAGKTVGRLIEDDMDAARDCVGWDDEDERPDRDEITEAKRYRDLHGEGESHETT